MSNLMLNEQVQPYKPFEGKNIEQMPLLLKEGMVPISVYSLMERRLEVLESAFSEKVRDSWWNNCFDTGDASAYDTQGNVKIVLDAQPLRTLNPKSRLKNGALVLPEDIYNQLDGQEFTKEQVAKYSVKFLQEGQSVDNPMWVALARGDTAMLKAYEKVAFAKAKEFGCDTAMGLFTASAKDVYTMRLWCLGSVGGGYLSSANGSDSILLNSISFGCLVGRAQEMGRSPYFCAEKKSDISFLESELSAGKSRTEQGGVTPTQVDWSITEWLLRAF